MRCLGRLALPTQRVFGISASSANPLTWVHSGGVRAPRSVRWRGFERGFGVWGDGTA